MNLRLPHRRSPSLPAPDRPSLPRPVTAVLTGRLDDVTVADTAAPARGGQAADRDRPAPAGRHRSPVVVASRGGPSGLDACTPIKAAVIRGGPFVHAVAPCPGRRSRRPALPPDPSRTGDAKEGRSS
ncbi:hypothetical protein SAMN05216505_111171 [Streptomyces prasinopilosus]|uniref:Uncharacterized protein n=1 Tax=Streptomyces prasinopilosus TaxID=67344 RepID=A0A1G6XCA2_9ACTN|nr:hypothetical protein SAMN05216505_111171 [Streptomyces prasinopilosus]